MSQNREEDYVNRKERARKITVCGVVAFSFGHLVLTIDAYTY